MPATRWRAVLLAVIVGTSGVGCDATLPEPESPGARLYADRCAAGCHRLYAPSGMTSEMWKITMARMQGVLVRAGMPPLSASEEVTVLEYLQRHSSDRRAPE